MKKKSEPKKPSLMAPLTPFVWCESVPKIINRINVTYPQPILHDGHGLVHDERQAKHADVVLEIVADAQVLQHRHAHPLQVFAGPDTRQHQQLRATDAPRREDHFALRVDRVQTAVAQKLHARRLVGRRVDDHFRHVRVHGDVQVGPEPRRPQKRLGRAATGAPPDRALKTININYSVFGKGKFSG